MAGVNYSALGELLKRTYSSDVIAFQQNLMIPMSKFMKRATDAKSAGGAGLYFSVSLAGDENYGYDVDDAPLIAAGNELVKQALVSPKKFRGAFKITNFARAMAGGNDLSFADGLRYHVDMKLKRMLRYKEGALFRDGSGKLGQFNGGPSDTTTATAVNTPGANAFRTGMLVDVLDTSTGAKKVSGAQVTAVDRLGNTVTFGTNFASLVGASDGLYISGTQPATGGPVSREITGLDAAIASSGTYLGILRSSYPDWSGNTFSASSAFLDEDMLRRAEEEIRVVGGVDFNGAQIAIHPNQKRILDGLAVSRMRYAGGGQHDLKPDATWGDQELIVSDQCPSTTVYVGDFSYFQWFYSPDGEMRLDDTGGDTIKWLPGYDAACGFWREWAECAVRKPNAFVKITSLADVTNA